MAVPFGKFQLLRKIASGGMGQVFLAREEGGAGIQRHVVLKLILPHLAEDEEFITMFLEEARLVAPLSHPNLITILEVGEQEGRYFLAMEYIQGEDARRIDKFARAQQRPMPVGQALRVIADAAAGLDYAHKARDAQGHPLKLVHRDVSPQNILVGFDGSVKVIDFGVAKAAGSSLHTATGILKGKYPYMSPEQGAGKSIDHRSDQFALGIVLWELLTGRRLFKGESDMMTLRLVQECQVPAPSQLNPKLPPGLDELVLQALAPTAAQRFPDCAAFRLALEDYVIQYRLPASSAHLSAWLRGLYAERITREEDPANLDQLSEDVDLDSQSNPSRSSASVLRPGGGKVSTGGSRPNTRSRAARPAEPLPVEATRRTASLEMPPELKRRFPVVPVVSAVALLLVGAGVTAFLMRPPPAPVEPPPARPVQALPQPVEAPPVQPVQAPLQVVAPQVVAVELTTVPEGASVQVDGQPRGPSPVRLELEEDTTVTVALALEGYEPVSQRVSAQDAPRLEVKLTKRPVRTTPTTTRKPPSSPFGIKTGR